MSKQAPVKRQRVTLAQPIIQGGIHKAAGEQVELTPAQIERLRATGHVATDRKPQGERS